MMSKFTKFKIRNNKTLFSGEHAVLMEDPANKIQVRDA